MVGGALVLWNLHFLFAFEMQMSPSHVVRFKCYSQISAHIFAFL